MGMAGRVASQGTYQLVSANDGHDTERFDVVFVGLERGVCALVAEDDVRVDFGVQVVNASPVFGNSVLEAGLTLCVATATAAAVLARAALLSVTVDVHVGKLRVLALEVECTRLLVLAVSKVLRTC